MELRAGVVLTTCLPPTENANCFLSYQLQRLSNISWQLITMKFASSAVCCFLVYVVYKKYYRKNNVEFPEGRDNEPVPKSSF